MIQGNLDTVAQNLEKQELEAAATGVSVPPQVYSQLLAIYLYQYDLCNAKYLWKRIPNSIKFANTELQNIWKVGKKMWQRDFPGIYMALNEQWSNDVADIMQKLLEKVRQKAAHLVATAYTSLSLEALSAFTGLPPDRAAQQGLEAGWQVDPDTNIVRPCRPTTNPAEVVSCEDQISKLTDFSQGNDFHHLVGWDADAGNSDEVKDTIQFHSPAVHPEVRGSLTPEFVMGLPSEVVEMAK